MPLYTGTSIAAGDGQVVNDGDTVSWADIKARGTGVADTTTDPARVYASVIGAGTWYLGRIFLPFDTSSIGVGNSVSSGSLVINIGSVFGTAGTVHLVQGNQASGGTLVSADFGSMTLGIGNSGGSLAVSATGLGTIVLNSTALEWISLTGTSMLGLSEDHDIRDVDPDPNDYRFGVNTTENATPGNRPTLTLNYSAIGGLDLTSKYW